MRIKKGKRAGLERVFKSKGKKVRGINKSLSSFNNLLNDRDLMMVGDFRYFGIERFNYMERSK